MTESRSVIKNRFRCGSPRRGRAAVCNLGQNDRTARRTSTRPSGVRDATRRTSCSNSTVVTRASAGPTANCHANAVFPCDAGCRRMSSERTRGENCWMGCMTLASVRGDSDATLLDVPRPTPWPCQRSLLRRLGPRALQLALSRARSGLFACAAGYRNKPLAVHEAASAQANPRTTR